MIQKYYRFASSLRAAEGRARHFFSNMFFLHASQMKLSWVQGTGIGRAIPAVAAPMHYGFMVIIFPPLNVLFTLGELYLNHTIRNFLIFCFRFECLVRELEPNIPRLTITKKEAREQEQREARSKPSIQSIAVD